MDDYWGVVVPLRSGRLIEANERSCLHLFAFKGEVGINVMQHTIEALQGEMVLP